MSGEEREIDAHKVSLEELCKRFNTNVESGLTKEQVAEGQKEHGPNQIRNPPQVPIWVRLCCFCFCLKEIKKNGLSYGPEYQKNPAKSTHVRRNGSTVEISAEDLTVGDIVDLKAGDLVPADIRIIKSDGLKVIIIIMLLTMILLTINKVEQSSLTGESEPKAKKPEFSHENPLETQNLAFFNTRAAEGSCTGIVINVGMNTVYGRIAHLSSDLS